MNSRTRIIALILAGLLVFSTVGGLFSILVFASTPGKRYSAWFVYTDSDGKETEVTGLRAPKENLNIRFRYLGEKPNKMQPGETLTLVENEFNVGPPWGKIIDSENGINNTTLKLEVSDSIVDGTQLYYITVTLCNVKYKIHGVDKSLYVRIPSSAQIDAISFSTTLPDSVFGASTGTGTDSSTGSSGNDADDEINASSDIVVESVHVLDSAGKAIDKVTKDTPAFNVEIIYADFGLTDVAYRDYRDDLACFMTSGTGIVPTGSNRGTLTTLSTLSGDGAPRFKATFRGLTFDGTANTLNFRAQYVVDGTPVKGEATATVHQAAVNEEEKDKLSPIKPHIIVSQYSYGEGQIPAGSEFTLNLTIRNTSADIPLENVIMTITPQTVAETTSGSTQGGLTITSASNTTYIEAMPPGGTVSHSISLRAESNAAVGSHKVELTFGFQYVDAINEKREESDDKESIAIPVTQIDRFSVDPLTEVPDIIVAGDTGYITVSFVNRGKTTTYNISGTLRSDMSAAGQSQHFGNLETGKTGSLDFDVTASEPGEMKGSITLQYEDENGGANEIELPFTILVEEPYRPAPDPEILEPDTTGETGFGPLNYILCGTGGLLIGVPMALYLFKRVRIKGIEALDEDF